MGLHLLLKAQLLTLNNILIELSVNSAKEGIYMAMYQRLDAMARNLYGIEIPIKRKLIWFYTSWYVSKFGIDHLKRVFDILLYNLIEI